ncbi:MAG TPA: Yip1 family protein [Vicinamibacterales bacterium]|nr:Yip1 family protein [Vicinamibacterales bacterium]
MDIVSRAKNICLAPMTEWPVIAEEQTSAGTLITGYVAPLAAIGAVAGLVGGSVIGRSLPFIGYYRVPILAGVVGAVFSFVMAIVGIFVLAFIIDALAPSFGGQKNNAQALKVAVYSYTPAWIAGVLQILPLLGVLAIIGALYGLYLLYLGLPRLMHCPEDRAIGYTAVVVVCAIILSIVIASVGGVVIGAGAFGASTLAGAGGFGAGTRLGGPAATEIQFDKNSAMGKLQDISKKLEESNKKAEAAAKKGDQNAQVAAAMEGLGTLLGGGKHVDPINTDELKAYLPETFAGLPKTASNAEKNGIAGLMVSKASATYGDGADKTITLEIADSGGVSGLVGLAGWANVQSQHEDANGSERTDKINGRMTHEKSSKVGGNSEFSIVLGDRFVVTATGRRMELAPLKAAVSGLDLGKLEAMKDAGVQR